MEGRKSKDLVVIDFNRLFSKLLSYWWLYVICIGLAYAGSYLYLRYSVSEYSARAVMLIKDTGRSGNISEQSIIAAGTGMSGGKAMDNEIQILKSLSLLEKVGEDLNLRVSYFRVGQVKESELYKNTPVHLDSFGFANASAFGTSFFIEMENYESFIYKRSEDDEEGKKFFYNVPFETSKGSFLLKLNPDVAVISGLYKIRIRSLESVAFRLRSKMSIKRIGDQSASSVLELTYTDPVSEKAKDILNATIDKYNEEEIKDENKVYMNTLEFIDNRISDLIIELDSVEGGIQRYKSSNEIINSSAAASMNYTLGEIRGAIKKMSDYDVKQNILESLERFINTQTENTALIPANLNAEEPALSSLVTQYNNLVLRNNQLSNSASELNPARSTVLEQIATIRDLILKTIQNLKRDLKIPMAEIEDNISDLRRSISNIPGIEKRLIEKMRMQEVKEALFLYLLQKKEETALSEAITTAKTRTIDYARTSWVPIYPRPKMVRSAGLALGLIIPTFFVLGLSLLENKVDSIEMIKQNTDMPILGTVGQSKTNEPIVVKEGNRSAINEMFRLLRTNLNFINQGKDKQTYLVSSTFSGEGKTFVALNLGLALALTNKKVIIVGLDLRKPKLGSYLKESKGAIGVSNYLIGQNSLEEVVKQSKEHANLSYITSGPIPPNPAELILGDRLTEMLDHLKERYDYVLLDTPPLGLVSDALLLRKQVDNILMIVRYKMTKKAMLKNLQEMYADGELENASIIFNGVKRGRGYYGYGGYKYGGKSGYYEDE